MSSAALEFEERFEASWEEVRKHLRKKIRTNTSTETFFSYFDLYALKTWQEVRSALYVVA